jgi:hypothetical protein
VALLPDGTDLAAVEYARSVYYSNADCTGQAVLSQESQPFIKTTVALGSAVLFRVSDEVAEWPWLSFVSGSFRATTQQDCDSNYGLGHSVLLAPNYCCVRASPGSTTVTGTPAVSLDLGQLGFQAPFHIEGP